MINRDTYLIKEHPEFHPLSYDYSEFWQGEIQRCIEGVWRGGYWVPGRLYFYGNYSTIELSKKGATSRMLGRPRIRDIEWEVLRYWEEARGFAGFLLDDIDSCNKILLEDLTDEQLIDYCYDEEGQFLDDTHASIFNTAGQRKNYVPARDYLKRQFAQDMGRPLYTNQASNFLMIGPRGYGKSYIIANIVAHEFIFDGQYSYKAFIKNATSKEPGKSNSLVCAGDAKYSTATCNKIALTLKMLPGGQQIGPKYYPAPMSKKTRGSLMAGAKKGLEAFYKRKRGNEWEDAGTKSVIKNRTFKDNPFATQGERSGLMIWDEIGFFNNLAMAYGANVDVMEISSWKFGSAFFTGTGGDFEGSGTVDAQKMYYNPGNYKCLTFEDPYEKAGITGLFFPAEFTNEKFKNKQGFSTPELLKAGRQYYLDRREEMKAGKSDSVSLDNFIVYHPIFPSEVFLTKEGNIFPVAELQARLNTLRRTRASQILSKKIKLYYDQTSKEGVGYKIDTSNSQPIDVFPWESPNKEGAIIMYELPERDADGNIPEDLYLIGHDPYASDNPSGASLGAIYVLKSKRYGSAYGHDEIVAQYVGRPYQGRAVINEALHKLSMFYGGAKVYFENAVGNVKEYFEKQKSLFLLARTPRTVLAKKASFDVNLPMTYGYPMSNKAIKIEALTYLRDWLLEVQYYDDNENPVRNLDKIYDEALLEELIQFNFDGNFDRVMALAGAVVGIEETYNQYTESLKDRGVVNSKKYLSFLTDNQKIFQKSYEDQLIPELQKPKDKNNNFFDFFNR